MLNDLANAEAAVSWGASRPAASGFPPRRLRAPPRGALVGAFMAANTEVTVNLDLSDRLVTSSMKISIGAVHRRADRFQSGQRAPGEMRRVVVAAYLVAQGVPRTPADLVGHNCLSSASSGLAVPQPGNRRAGKLEGGRQASECNDGAVLHEA